MAPLLYIDLMSQPCRSLYMYIKMCNINCNFKMIALRKGEHQTDQFLEINPLGKVPVLKDGDFLLTESIAILRYLDAKYRRGNASLYPEDLQKRAKVDEYLEWQHLNTRMKASTLFISTLMMRGATRIEEAAENLTPTLNQLEFMFLKDQPFLTGNEVTIADLFAVHELLQATIGTRDLFKDFPKLKAWFERVKQSTEPFFSEATLPFNGVNERFTRKFKL